MNILVIHAACSWSMAWEECCWPVGSGACLLVELPNSPKMVFSFWPSCCLPSASLTVLSSWSQSFWCSGLSCNGLPASMGKGWDDWVRVANRPRMAGTVPEFWGQPGILGIVPVGATYLRCPGICTYWTLVFHSLIFSRANLQILKLEYNFPLSTTFNGRCEPIIHCRHPDDDKLNSNKYCTEVKLSPPWM